MILPPLLAAIAPICGANGDIQAFLGDPASGGQIESFAEGTGQLQPAQPELRGLHLLPVDFNGRLDVDNLLSGQPRHHDDIPGAGRIVLPNGLGVLYRFERNLPGLSTRFGYLRIEADGTTHLIAERFGTGVGGAQDPYGDRLALSPDGTHALVGTTVVAGGNLLEVDLVSGAMTDRSASLSPLEFRPQSLRWLQGWIVAVTTGGIYRAGAAATDPLELVPLEEGVTTFTGELVSSDSGLRVLTTAGSALNSLHAWTFTNAGAAVRATRDPHRMTEAGFLPEFTHGPFMAVSDDGHLCAWRARIDDSNELFVRRLDVPPTVAAAHVTNDLDFTDTLDETGVLGMSQVGSVVFTVGEKGEDLGVGIEKADFFEVSVDATGATSVVNLSGTSGELSAPYLASPIMSPLFMRWLPAAQGFIMYDEWSGGTGRLAFFDPTTPGVQTLIADVKEVFFIELIGNSVLVSLRMDTGSKPHRILRLNADLSGTPTIEYDAGNAELTHSLADPAGWLAFLEVPEFGHQKLHRYDLLADTLETFPVSALAFGPVLAWSEHGDLAFSLDRGGLRYFAAWPRGGAPYRMQAVASDGAILPGR